MRIAEKSLLCFPPMRVVCAAVSRDMYMSPGIPFSKSHFCSDFLLPLRIVRPFYGQLLPSLFLSLFLARSFSSTSSSWLLLLVNAPLSSFSLVGDVGFLVDNRADLLSSDARRLPLSRIREEDLGKEDSTPLFAASWPLASVSVGARLGVLLVSLDK